MNISDVWGKNFAIKNISKKINNTVVEIKSYVDADMFANIVDTIASSCFKDGEYRAWNREIAKRFSILRYMTNIDVSEENITEIFKRTQVGGWYSEIERIVTELPIWSEVELAIDKQIDAIMNNQPTAFDNLCDSLSTILNTDQSAKLDDIKKVLDGLNKVDRKAFVEAVVDANLERNKD